MERLLNKRVSAVEVRNTVLFTPQDGRKEMERKAYHRVYNTFYYLKIKTYREMYKAFSSGAFQESE